MPRRTVTAILASLPLLVGLAGPSAAASEPVFGPQTFSPQSPDALLITVHNSADPTRNGTYTLSCDPVGGSHPDPAGACAALESSGGKKGGDPFKPIGPKDPCSMIHGGVAKAHVVGTWHGREVDAHFSRSNGCEIERWNALVPALPKS